MSLLNDKVVRGFVEKIKGKLNSLKPKIESAKKYINVSLMVLLVLSIAVGVYLVNRPKEIVVSNAYDTLEGTLLAVIVDDFDNNQSSTEYYIRLKDKRRLRLNVEGDFGVSPGSLVRVNTNQRSKSFNEYGLFVESDQVEVLSDVGTAVSSEGVIGDRRVAIILMNFSDTNNDTPSVQEASTNFFNRVEPYYKENSFGKLKVLGDAYGWYTFPDLDPTCTFSCMTQIAIDLADSDINYDLYDQIIVSYHSHAGGQSNSSTVGAWWDWDTDEGVKSFPVAHIGATTLSDAVDPGLNRNLANTINHELGHSFGVWHANGFDCEEVSFILDGCDSYPYADFYEVMGESNTANLIAHFGGYHKELFGWFDETNIQNVVTSGTYEIYPIEIQTDGPQILKIQWGIGEWFYLENRINYGYDANLPAAAVEGLIIRSAPTLLSSGDTHLLDSTPNPNDYFWDFMDAGWAYGTTFWNQYHQFGIKPLWKKNNVLSVQIDFLNLESASPVPIIASPSPSKTPRVR